MSLALAFSSSEGDLDVVNTHFQGSCAQHSTFLTHLTSSSRIQVTAIMPFESFSTSSSQIFAYAKFDLEALCSRATTLRQGVSCIGDPNQHPASGSFNWTIFVSFEDGVRWIFRSPHSKQFQPAEIGRKILASEAATLRYLRAHSDIPVPEVYDYWYVTFLSFIY